MYVVINLFIPLNNSLTGSLSEINSNLSVVNQSLNTQNPILLWSNANASAAFSAQTIQINKKAEFDFVEIVSVYNANLAIQFSARGKKGAEVYSVVPAYNGSKTITIVRRTTVNTTNIIFGNCYSDNAIDNMSQIPLYIIGYNMGIF